MKIKCPLPNLNNSVVQTAVHGVGKAEILAQFSDGVKIKKKGISCKSNCSCIYW